jgi:ribosome-binding factor A
VFYTVFGDDVEHAGSAAALETAKGQMRTEVGRQTGIKFTPTLTFVLDRVPESARQIDDLLAVARNADAQVSKARENAVHAGETDPYRKPRDAGQDD